MLDFEQQKVVACDVKFGTNAKKYHYYLSLKT
jgi:hypothetical protein